LYCLEDKNPAEVYKKCTATAHTAAGLVVLSDCLVDRNGISM
jgi:hypothetical protein